MSLYEVFFCLTSVKKLFAPQDSSMLSISSSSNLLPTHLFTSSFFIWWTQDQLKVQSSGGEKMLMLMLMLMVEATTWLPTLQFELLLVSACKFCNFESYLDNARRTWQGWWWWGATWWWSPPLFSLLWLPRRTSLLIFKYSTSSYNLHLSAIMLLNPDCVGRKWKLLLRGLLAKVGCNRFDEWLPGNEGRLLMGR